MTCNQLTRFGNSLLKPPIGIIIIIVFLIIYDTGIDLSCVLIELSGNMMPENENKRHNFEVYLRISLTFACLVNLTKWHT